MNSQRCSNTPQLVHWYRLFLEHGKSAAFVSLVATRYSHSTLQRMTISPDCEVRRAAVLALGMLGTGDSIPTVGACLKDPDRCVRLVAEIAFTDLLRREVGMKGASELEAIRRHVDGGRYRRAAELLETLTTETYPDFSEAWYLRSIAHFGLGKMRDAIRLARQARELNEFHYAAFALEGRCWMALNNPLQALKLFEKSFSINPSQVAVKQYIDQIRRAARRLNPDDRA